MYVGRVYHVLLADTLDRTPLVTTEKLMNKMCQFDAILVLMERTLGNGVRKKIRRLNN